MTDYEDAADCPICPQLATDRDDALREVEALRGQIAALGHALPWLLDGEYRATSATLYPKSGTIQVTLKPVEATS